MVVESLDTDIAVIAMRCSRRSVNKAAIAKLQREIMSSDRHAIQF